jgi:DNA-binding LacI/PurR family transcriptional regulator
MVTMQDVARRAGVSISTVSRVLRNDESVEQSNRARVRKAIQESGYRARPTTRRNGADRRIAALIVPNISNPFYATIVKGIEHVARTHDYGVLVYDSEESVEVENHNLASVVKKNARGLIYVSCVMEPNEVVEGLIRDQFPLVFLDRIAEDENTNVVFSDNVEGAYHAVKYLLQLGHRHIVYVAGIKTSSTERDRYRGYCEALADEGIAVDERLIVSGEYNLDAAYEGLKQLIAKGIEFTAVFSSNDLMAFGVKQALEESGRRVPDDASVVGYDDISFSHTISLTVVSQPIVEMGKSAMTLLLDLIYNRVTPPQRIVHRPSLIIRSSCQRR